MKVVQSRSKVVSSLRYDVNSENTIVVNKTKPINIPAMISSGWVSRRVGGVGEASGARKCVKGWCGGDTEAAAGDTTPPTISSRRSWYLVCRTRRLAKLSCGGKGNEL